MESDNTLVKILEAFCHAWFVERNAEKAAAFLADDVSFVGTGDNEFARGKEAFLQYLNQDIKEIPEPFICSFSVIQERKLTEQVRNICVALMLKNTLYTWKLRGFFTFVDAGTGWLIKSLHFAEPSRNQREDEHYPHTLVMENMMRQRQALWNDSLPGGMMGGYMEEGFPFYFINRKMLDYLGYETQEEFVADIGGLVTNCMHPDDCKMVEDAVTEQLKDKEEYEIEYRMKKKDGSYIWVQDLGRLVTAEDGRKAIISVCIDITTRRKAQEEVMHLYNNIPGAVFRCRFDRDYSIIDANDGLFDFLGYTREEFAAMGNQMSAVIYPEDFAVMEDRLRAQLIHGNTIHNENRLICKDGTVKWISVKAQFMKDSDGEEYFYCVFVDITDEKKLQERVQELYEKELAYFAVRTSGEKCVQGRINVTQNRVMSCMPDLPDHLIHTGTTYEDAVIHLTSAAVREEDARLIREQLERGRVTENYAAGKTEYRFEFLGNRENDNFWEGLGLRFCSDPATGDLIAFFHASNITEQKLQEHLISRIKDLDYDVIMEIDMRHDRHRWIACNSGQENTVPPQGSFREGVRLIAEKYTEGREKEEYLEKMSYSYMKEQLEMQDTYTFMVEMRDDSGLRRVKRFKVFYISRELECVCIARADVTDIIRKEQKQKEELAAALTAAEQANAAKTDFLSRMSHEIRTPMNAIIGMSSIAARSIGNEEQVADCISKIGISSRFLLSLINDILDMSRIESGKMLLKNEKIPTEEFLCGINSICYTQASAKGVEYECIVDPVLDDYYIGDAMKLQQVLINILSNAVKFTREGGKVTFSVSLHKRMKNDAVLRFIVNDTGIGMSEEFLNHIFEPFAQESVGTTALYGGTGLGLAISKNIVDMMGGKILVRSIRGIGTEFTVDVRLGITEEEKLRHNQKKHSYNFSHIKTLVVDDDVTVCETAVATLHEMGVRAEWVDSGYKAVERVKELWGQGKYYDMVLIDWKMPDMDGIETARQIRKIVGPEVTIIIMTAYDWSSIEQEAKVAGVNMLMSKPMFKSTLISAFTRALGEKEEQEEEKVKKEYDFTGRRVLLAEDNQINTEVAELLLTSRGFEVETAENGLRALEKFSKSESGYFDAILMDIRMPIMDGLSATRNIRHLSNADAESIPIIAMTANAFDDDIEKSKAAGMNAHLAKPIEPERLYQTLYDFIYRKEE